MVVRISTNSLRKGMFVEAVEIESSKFDRRRFLIETEEQLREISSTHAKYILVNTRLSNSSFASGEALGVSKTIATPDACTVSAQALESLNASLRGGLSAILTCQQDPSKLEALTDELRAVVEQSPAAFYQLTRLQSFDEGTYKHSLAVSGLMMQMGAAFGFDSDVIRQFGVAGLVHDIGKLLLPPSILNKPGALSDSEKRIIRAHPKKGCRILKRVGAFPELVLEITRHHHELLDGSGYPAGLKGSEIPLGVRISTICDVFDALTSVRPYKQAWDKNDALRWLIEKPQWFDSKLALRLAAILDF